ncbi:MAG: NAD-dependent malic enzyme, partial [Ignavibacteria bacterium]|nr:NAD-dependent malic enzyme [Ignavibacteria bacterium]
LGALVSQSSKITDRMFLSASKALSSLVTKQEKEKGLLLPSIRNIREVAVYVAKAVAIESRNSGLGRLVDDDEYERLIRKAQWYPRYYPMRPPVD